MSVIDRYNSDDRDTGLLEKHKLLLECIELFTQDVFLPFIKMPTMSHAFGVNRDPMLYLKFRRHKNTDELMCSSKLPSP